MGGGSPPSRFGFELALRADERLNVTVRLARLMAALSQRTGYASMSVERMAAELQASPEAVRKARRKLVRLGYFEPPQGWKYRRARVEGDDGRGDFWQRMRTDRRLDLAARCAFLLVDLTAKSGQVEVSYAEIGAHLDTDHPVRAVWKVTELDSYFTRAGGGAGQRNTYKRLWDHYESETTEHDDEYQHQEPGTDRPYAFARRSDHRRERAAAHR
jgi:hypothetical protein